jgi:hypothetical protein
MWWVGCYRGVLVLPSPARSHSSQRLWLNHRVHGMNRLQKWQTVQRIAAGVYPSPAATSRSRPIRRVGLSALSGDAARARRLDFRH